MRTFCERRCHAAGQNRKRKITNIRIYPGDVRDLFDVLPEKSIAKAFCFIPIPGPKNATTDAVL